MQRLPSVRASDSDREQAVERLQRATAEGRLSPNELEERLESLFAARTYGEIDALLADLPATPATRARAEPLVRLAPLAGAVGVFTLMLAMFGMLASIRRHAEVAAAGGGRFRGFERAFPYSHHALAPAVSLVGVVAVVLVCAAALFWVLRQRRAASDG